MPIQKIKVNMHLKSKELYQYLWLLSNWDGQRQHSVPSQFVHYQPSVICDSQAAQTSLRARVGRRHFFLFLHGRELSLVGSLFGVWNTTEPACPAVCQIKNKSSGAASVWLTRRCNNEKKFFICVLDFTSSNSYYIKKLKFSFWSRCLLVSYFVYFEF